MAAGDCSFWSYNRIIRNYWWLVAANFRRIQEGNIFSLFVCSQMVHCTEPVDRTDLTMQRLYDWESYKWHWVTLALLLALIFSYSYITQSCNDLKFQITTSWHFAVSSRRTLPSYATCFLWPRHHQPHHFSHKTLSQLAFPTPFCRVICFMLTINLEICAVPSVYRPVVAEPKIKQLNAV